MTIDTVLNALLFWRDTGTATTWTRNLLPVGHPQYVEYDKNNPRQFSASDEARYTNYIRDLYSRSARMRSLLDSMADSGPIRIAAAGPASYGDSALNPLHCPQTPLPSTPWPDSHASSFPPFPIMSLSVAMGGRERFSGMMTMPCTAICCVNMRRLTALLYGAGC